MKIYKLHVIITFTEHEDAIFSALNLLKLGIIVIHVEYKLIFVHIYAFIDVKYAEMVFMESIYIFHY